MHKTTYSMIPFNLDFHRRNTYRDRKKEISGCLRLELRIKRPFWGDRNVVKLEWGDGYIIL